MTHIYLIKRALNRKRIYLQCKHFVIIRQNVSSSITCTYNKYDYNDYDRIVVCTLTYYINAAKWFVILSGVITILDIDSLQKKDYHRDQRLDDKTQQKSRIV